MLLLTPLGRQAYPGCVDQGTPGHMAAAGPACSSCNLLPMPPPQFTIEPGVIQPEARQPGPFPLLPTESRGPAGVG